MSITSQLNEIKQSPDYLRSVTRTPFISGIEDTYEEILLESSALLNVTMNLMSLDLENLKKSEETILKEILSCISSRFSRLTSFIDYLIDKQVDKKLKNITIGTHKVPLICFLAVFQDYGLIQQLHAKCKIDLSQTDSLGRGILHYAVMSLKDGYHFTGHSATNGYISLIKFIQESVKIQSRDLEGKTALHHAAQHANEKAANALMDSNIDMLDNQERTPLHYAVQSGAIAMVQKFIAQGSNINAQDSEGETPLHHAVLSGSIKMVEFLLKKGAICTANNNGNTPIHIATSLGRIDMVELLQKYDGFNLNTPNGEGLTPVHMAVKNDDLVTIRRFNVLGADLEAFSSGNITPMASAACSGHLPIVDFFLQAGVSSETSDNNGTTPFLHAAKNACIPTMTTILTQRSEALNETDSDDLTALHYAAVNEGGDDALAFLLSKGINVDTRDKYNRTALHFAASSGLCHIMDILLKANADIHAVDNKGRSVLHIALQHQQESAFHFSLRHSANISINDNEGKSTIDYAREYCSDQLAHKISTIMLQK